MDARMSVSAARVGFCLSTQGKLNKSNTTPPGSYYSRVRETTRQSSSTVNAMLMTFDVSLARA